MNIHLGMQRGSSLRSILLITLAFSYSRALDVPNYITDIDEKARQIDQLQASELKKSLITGTDRGGTLSAFLYKGKIRHLRIIIGMSNRQLEQNYYYDNGNLVLARSTQSFFLWDEKLQRLDPLRTARSVEDRYYFIDGKLKQWNTSRSASDSSNQDSNFSTESNNILRQSTFFITTATDAKDTLNIETFIKEQRP